MKRKAWWQNLNVKKMILSSMLITNALTIFIIEAQLPPIAPIPGIKLGLANVVTLFAIYLLGYKEAAKERKNADKLSYEAGTSILTFGADISKQKIKDIVADQYGECEYIYKCTDGTYIVKVKNSLGLTVDKAVDAYGAYDETMQVARNDKVEQI